MSRHLDALAVLAHLDDFVASTARSRSPDERHLPTLLRSLVDAAATAVPGAHAAGILECSPHGVLSHHATDASIEELDRLGHDVQEGPVVAAGTHATSAAAIITALDDEAARRWPHWTAAAHAVGVASTLTVALPVTLRRRTTVLTFYGTQADGLDQAAVETAQAFAAPIAVTLQAVDHTGSLLRAITSRDVIGQAKGMLMERHGLSAGDAFDRLVRISQRSNVRLADVATWLVGRASADDARVDPHRRPRAAGDEASATVTRTAPGVRQPQDDRRRGPGSRGAAG
jgi:hypothetical protein